MRFETSEEEFRERIRKNMEEAEKERDETYENIDEGFKILFYETLHNDKLTHSQKMLLLNLNWGMVGGRQNGKSGRIIQAIEESTKETE